MFVPDDTAPDTAALHYYQSMFIFSLGFTRAFDTELLRSRCVPTLYQCKGFIHSRCTILHLSLLCFLGFLSSPSLQPAWVHLNGGHAFKQIDCMHQLGVIWKFNEGELWPLLQIAEKDIRQGRVNPWKKPITGLQAEHTPLTTHPLGLGAQTAFHPFSRPPIQTHHPTWIWRCCWKGKRTSRFFFLFDQKQYFWTAGKKNSLINYTTLF